MTEELEIYSKIIESFKLLDQEAQERCLAWLKSWHSSQINQTNMSQYTTANGLFVGGPQIR